VLVAALLAGNETQDTFIASQNVMKRDRELELAVGTIVYACNCHV
jgi:hypothetical protein